LELIRKTILLLTKVKHNRKSDDDDAVHKPRSQSSQSAEC